MACASSVVSTGHRVTTIVSSRLQDLSTTHLNPIIRAVVVARATFEYVRYIANGALIAGVVLAY